MPSIDYEALTSGARVHGSLYRDPAIFARELEAIWYKVWVYIGHESEIPEPGDFVRRAIGLQPVVMVRGDDGAVGVSTTAAGIAATWCAIASAARATTLKCPYHGWTYDRAGALLAADLRGRLRLGPAARGFRADAGAARRRRIAAWSSPASPPTGIIARRASRAAQRISSISSWISRRPARSSLQHRHAEAALQRQLEVHAGELARGRLPRALHPPRRVRAARQAHRPRYELALRERDPRRDPLAARRAHGRGLSRRDDGAAEAAAERGAPSPMWR